LPIFSLTEQSLQQPVAAPIHQEGSPVADVATKLEPVEKPSTMKVIRKVGSAFTPSIKDALSGNPPESKVQEDAQKTIFSQYQENDFEPFTQEQLAARWNEFLEKIVDRPSLRSALSEVPELTDNNKLFLKIGNSVQEEDVRLIKPELVSWLRKELRNSGIELTTKIEKIESERMIFSDSEKLQMMLQKNPDLYELKQKFNLDFNG
jgi:DNA polymerase-3 subunit gamma/tau